MTETTEIRCSSLPRLELCPGSVRAAARIQDAGGAAADSGTLVHKGLKRLATLDLINGPAETMQEAAEEIAVKLEMDPREHGILVWFSGIIHAIAESRGGALTLDAEVARRLEIGGAVLTGSPDLIMECAHGDSVIEYKTGRLDQATAERHVQGQAYCLLGVREDAIRLHVLAAGNPRETAHTWVDYADEGLAFIRQKITSIVEAASKADAPRIPSPDACRYCRAGGTLACPESCTAVEKFGANIIRMSDPVAMFLALPPAQRAATLERIRQVRPLLEKMEAAAKEGLKLDPGFIPGWQVGPSTAVREITDATACFRLLHEAEGISAAQYGAICKAPLGAVKKLYHEHRVAGCAGAKPPTAKADDAAVLELLAGVIEVKERGGALERVTE